MRFKLNLWFMQSRLLRTLLISYFLLLSIPLFIGGIGSYLLTETIEKETIKTNSMLLSQINTTVDLGLKSIYQTIVQTAQDNLIQRFFLEDRELGDYSRYTITEINNRITDIISSQDLIQNMFIYYTQSNIILTGNAMYNPVEYFNNHMNSTVLSFDEWENTILHSSNSNRFFSSKAINYEIHNQNIVTLYQSIPLLNKRNPYAVIGLLIDEDLLISPLLNASVYGSTLIIDKNNQIIASSKVEGREEERKYIAMIESDNDRVGDYIVASVESGFFNWKYVTFINMKIIASKANNLKIISFSVFTICLLMGLIFSYMIARKNFLPLKNLLDSIKDIIPIEQELSNQNEFLIINRAIKSAISVRDEFENKMDENKQTLITYRQHIGEIWPMAREALLVRLLLDKNLSPNSINNTLLNINFAFKKFAVIVISHNYSSATEVQSVVKNILIENATENFPYYLCTDLDGHVVVIFNFNAKNLSEASDIIVDYTQLIENFIEFKEKDVQSFFVGTGKIVESLFEIRQSYLSAKEEIDYSVLYNGYDKSQLKKEKKIKYNFYFPLEYEQKLFSNMITGNPDSCQEILMDLFDENFKKRELPTKLIHYLFFDLMSKALKFLEEINVDYIDIFGKDSDPIDRLTSCETIQSTYQEISRVYTKICFYMLRIKEEKKTELLNQIIQEINQNYFDSQLSQSQIADKFNISTSFLSTFFKKQSGKSMVDFINDLRIEKAKKMLLSTDMTMNAIAEDAGFGTDKTFFRVFKKYESITPGRYRETKYRFNKSHIK